MKRMKMVGVMCVVGLALCLASCLDADKEAAVRYDAKTDTFHVLRVYYNIRGKSATELAYLGALYDNRKEILPLELISIFGENAYLRMDAKHYYTISLGEAKAKPEKMDEAPVDLKLLANKPGHFFLSDEGALSYYHQVEIPGAAADSLLKEANARINKALGEAITAEIKRRKDGGKVLAWDMVRTWIFERQGGTGPAASEPAATMAATSQPTGAATMPTGGATASMDQNPLACLDVESLNMLMKGVTEGTGILTRSGSTFTGAVSLSAADRKEVMATWEAVKVKQAEMRKSATTEEDKKKEEMFAGLIELVKLAAGEGNRISASADLVAAQNLYERLAGTERFSKKMEEGKPEGYKETVDAATAYGITIDKGIKLGDVLARFNKGDLPVDAGMKVELGKGLFSEEAATEKAAPMQEEFKPK